MSIQSYFEDCGQQFDVELTDEEQHHLKEFFTLGRVAMGFLVANYDLFKLLIPGLPTFVQDMDEWMEDNWEIDRDICQKMFTNEAITSIHDKVDAILKDEDNNGN